MIELIVIAILIVICIFLVWVLLATKEELADLRYAKQSQSVKYGQLTEQWLPFANKYPYNSQNFRFIGKPIDGLAFEEDKIVFVEFKTNKSSLSQSQRRAKELVKEKKIEWLELRVE